MKPLLGLTIGDAAGVGPEITLMSLSDKKIYDICRPVVIGDLKIMNRAGGLVKSGLACRAVTDLKTAGNEYGVVDVIDLDNLPEDLPLAKVDSRAGAAAYEYVEKGVSLAMNGEIDAIVTAPLNKEALNLGGYHFPGHTEILAHLSGTKDYSMMLTSDALRVIHVTTHVSMRQACDLIKKDRVLRIITLAYETMRLMGIKNPRIAVAGLNPHSGERGLFGQEDTEEIKPAVEAGVEKGYLVTGPVPPDTVFYRAAVKKEFDIVVVMYHDQGHIPLKLLDFDSGVNVTVGLPFIRTSVDHGTAFDIAGKGMANCRSMTMAIALAAEMAGNRSRIG